MSNEEAKALISQYIERVWNCADAEALDALTTSGYTFHLGNRAARDKSAMRGFLVEVHSAFPDWRVEIENLVAEGGVVAARWQGRVTHEGPFRGIAPSGRKIDVCGINMYLIEDGKVACEWEQMDSLGMLEQLGVFS